MKKSLGTEPIMIPQPVLIVGTYDIAGVPNAMNVAWAGQCDYKHIMVHLSSHKTTDNMEFKRAFTVAFATQEQMVPADYVGLVSGLRVPDKITHTGWHVEKAKMVDAPVFVELPLVLECEVIAMDWYASMRERLVLGKVVNVQADESILDADGKVDLDKLHPIVFDPVAKTYRTVGSSIGEAWHVGMALK